MGMADGDSQRIGGVCSLEIGRRQQCLDHELDLSLVGMAGADHRFLDQVGGIFGDRQAPRRRRQQRHAARLPQDQRRTRPGIDEGFFHRGFLGRETIEHLAQPCE
ncbi:hypothetical protein D9M68_957810 [compost metagenome]